LIAAERGFINEVNKPGRNSIASVRRDARQKA
jgi:hypothetical protein